MQNNDENLQTFCQRAQIHECSQFLELHFEIRKLKVLLERIADKWDEWGEHTHKLKQPNNLSRDRAGEAQEGLGIDWTMTFVDWNVKYKMNSSNIEA